MRLSTYLIAIPVVVIAAILAVANRGDIIVSLDPFSREAPALALQMPLFAALFIVFGLGILIGWLAAVISRLKKN